MLWEEAVRGACDDAGARATCSERSSRCRSCTASRGPTTTLPRGCASRLGIEPKHRYYSGIGGTTPQVLVDHAAEAIVRGELDVGVVVGAEALDTVRRLRKADERPQWSFKPDRRSSRSRSRHRSIPPRSRTRCSRRTRRSRCGMSPAVRTSVSSRTSIADSMGELFSPMTTIAAAQPVLRGSRPSARCDELVDPAPDNRMVAYPYTKYLISVMDVDCPAR